MYVTERVIVDIRNNGIGDLWYQIPYTFNHLICNYCIIGIGKPITPGKCKLLKADLE